MGQGISAVLTFAVGVAISPLPIIAVMLMLFFQRARTAAGSRSSGSRTATRSWRSQSS